VRRDSGALRPERLLDHLDDDFLSLFEQVFDLGGRRRAFGPFATAPALSLVGGPAPSPVGRACPEPGRGPAPSLVEGPALSLVRRACPEPGRRACPEPGPTTGRAARSPRSRACGRGCRWRASEGRRPIRRAR
jgi:hypothetical protein